MRTFPPIKAQSLLTGGAAGSTLGQMDFDDLFIGKPADPLTEVIRQDLAPLSIDELDQRIAILKSEIERVQSHMAEAERHRASADELFKR